MRDRLAHRGPDDAGHWIDQSAGIALGHRRLSIVDLSPAGHQPMVSASGRYVLVFNGEIYNHLDLRKKLADAAPAWRGHSDTETLLALFEHVGIEATLKDAVGMFAIALWDRREHVLTLTRDRVGEKPLYYGWQNESLLFGSELKALRAHPSFNAEIDRDVLLIFVRHGFVPAPYSIYRGIQKILPGTFVQFDERCTPGVLPRTQTYWSLREIAETGISDRFVGSEDQVASELEALLMQAIAGQRLADVPLGAFLSGGIDSSTIVALMQAQSSTPVQTFTIGFHDTRHNEAEHAKAVARHLGTEHTEFFATPREAMELLPHLAEHFDEPFGDSSAIPTLMVSKLARQHVTVALSGDGGDEFFTGYRRYQRAHRLWSWVNRVPRAVRTTANSAASVAIGLGIDRFFASTRARQFRLPKDERSAQVEAYLAADTMEEFYRAQLSQWKNPAVLVVDGEEPLTALTDSDRFLRHGDLFDRMMYSDAVHYLPDDVLVKVDRASMAVSLEVRVPLLDHRVIEFASRLPLSLRVREKQGKWLLRKVLHRYVPKGLVERPKSGFSVPLGPWLRHELRDWAESLLSPDRIKSDGFFAVEAVQRYWQLLLSGNDYLSQPIWQLLCFQAWLSGSTRTHATISHSAPTSQLR